MNGTLTFAVLAAVLATPVATPSATAAPAGAAAVRPVVAQKATKLHARHSARIPGTFAVSNSAQSDDEALQEQMRLRVVFPALSGDGGG
jgi:hypothetical protein